MPCHHRCLAVLAALVFLAVSDASAQALQDGPPPQHRLVYRNLLVGRLNPLGGSWHPPTGSVVPLVVMVVGLVLLGWLFWRAPLLALFTGIPGVFGPWVEAFGQHLWAQPPVAGSSSPH